MSIRKVCRHTVDTRWQHDKRKFVQKESRTVALSDTRPPSTDRRLAPPRSRQLHTSRRHRRGNSPPIDTNNTLVPVRSAERQVCSSVADWRSEEALMKMIPAIRNRFKTCQHPMWSIEFETDLTGQRTLTCFVSNALKQNVFLLCYERLNIIKGGGGDVKLTQQKWWARMGQSVKTGWTTEESWFDSRQRENIFTLMFSVFRPVQGPTFSLLFFGYWGADHLPESKV